MAPFKFGKKKAKNGDSKRNNSVSKKDPKSPGTFNSVESNESTPVLSLTENSHSPVEEKTSAEAPPAGHEFVNNGSSNEIKVLPAPTGNQQYQAGGSGTPALMNLLRQLPLIPTAGQSLLPIEAQNNQNLFRSPPQQQAPRATGSSSSLGGPTQFRGAPNQGISAGIAHFQTQLPMSTGGYGKGPLASKPAAVPVNPFTGGSGNPVLLNLQQAVLNFTPWTRIKLNSSPFPRYRHTLSSVISEEGYVFVMGGLREGSVYGDLWALNTSNFEADSIENFDGIPAPRVGHNSCLCGNAFIIFGGDTIQTNELGELDNDLYLFNINSLKWTIPHPQGLKPCGRYGHSIGVVAKAVVSAKLFLYGGQLDSRIFNDLWMFDLSSFRKPTSHWEKIVVDTSDSEDLPALTNHSMVVFNYKLYIFGGLNLVQLSNELYCYDPTLNKVSRKKCFGDVPPPIEEHSATLIKNLMVVYGGKNSKNETVNDLYILNLNSMFWTKCEQFNLNPGARCGHSVTAIFNYKKNQPAPAAAVLPDDGKKFHNSMVNPTKISNNATALTSLSSSKNKLLIMGGDQLDYSTAKLGSFEKGNRDENFGTMIYQFDLDLYNDWLVKFKNHDLWGDKIPQQRVSSVPLPQQSQFLQDQRARSNSELNHPGSVPANIKPIFEKPIQEEPSKKVIEDGSREFGTPTTLTGSSSNIPGTFHGSNIFGETNGGPPKHKDSFALIERPANEVFSTPPTTTQASPETVTVKSEEPRLQSVTGLSPQKEQSDQKSEFDLLDTYVNSSSDLLEKFATPLEGDAKKLPISPPKELKKLEISHFKLEDEVPHTPTEESEGFAVPDKRSSIPVRSPKRNGSPTVESHGDLAALVPSAAITAGEQRSIDGELGTGTLTFAEKQKLAKLVENLENELTQLKVEMNTQAKSASDKIQELEAGNKELAREAQQLGGQVAQYSEYIGELEQGLSEKEQALFEHQQEKRAVLEQQQAVLAEHQQEKQAVLEEHQRALSSTADSHGKAVEQLQQELSEKGREIEELHGELLKAQENSREIIESSSPISSNKELNGLKIEHITAKAEMVKLRNNNETLQQKLDEFEPFMDNSIAELESLNKVITHQQQMIEDLTEEAGKADGYKDEIARLQSQLEVAEKELQGSKTDRSTKRYSTNDKLTKISTDINKMVRLWQSKKELVHDLDRNLITDESINESANEEDGNRSLLSNTSSSSSTRAVNQLHLQINDLIQINREQETKNDELEALVRELSEKLASENVKSHEAVNHEENYRNAMNSVKKTGKALEMSQKELNKQKDLNKHLQQEMEELKLKRNVSTSSGQGEEDEDEEDLKDAEFNMKIRDLEAELFITKQDRDELKEQVVAVKKQLINRDSSK